MKISTLRRMLFGWGGPFHVIDNERGLFRMRWLEISTRSGRWLGLELCRFNDPSHYSLNLSLAGVSVYLTLPFPCGVESEDMLDSWGFTFLGADFGWQVHTHWGPKRTHVFNMPWSWEWQRSWVRGRESDWKLLGKGEHVYSTDGSILPMSDRWVLPYCYTLKSGVVQERKATIYMDRMQWTWKVFARPKGLLRWWPWPILKTRESIDVHFSEEVGERSGSWKGGCTGCSYDIKPLENAEECLRRMERDRKF